MCSLSHAGWCSMQTAEIRHVKSTRAHVVGTSVHVHSKCCCNSEYLVLHRGTQRELAVRNERVLAHVH